MTGPLRAFYLTFSLVIGCVVWMLAYGMALQLLYRDGRVLQTTITTNPFAPFQQLMTYTDSPVLQGIALGAVLPAVAVAAIVAYAGLRQDSSPLGDASFQTMMSLRRGKWFQRKGHVLGRFGRQILRVDDERHHLVIGPTRSGKGAGYVVPNALIHEGSMIVTDLKGEIFRSTAGYRKSKGSQVFLFAPGSARTHRYNPLDYIRPDRGDRTTDIQNIAAILVPENTESENSIWQATAQQVMAGVISYINESVFYQGRRNLAEVTSFFNSGANLQALMALIKEREPYLSRFTLESFNAYIALSERAAASALLDIQKALRPFRNERIAAATSITDMDLRALKHRPVSIYLAPNITDITLLKPLLALFVQQTLDTLMLEHAAHTIPVYFLLDEFRQLKKMSEITTKLPYVAGYNIKMAFVIQDLKNLDEIYGETSRLSLMGNCGYQLVFGANDQVTAETVSKGLGKRTVRYKTESRTIELVGLHRRTKVEQLRERDLMMPQEVRQMPSNKMVILAEGQGPILGNKLRFFATTPFDRMEAFARANIPEVPAVEFLPPMFVPVTTEAYETGKVDHGAKVVAMVDPKCDVDSPRQGERISSWVATADGLAKVEMSQRSATPPASKHPDVMIRATPLFERPKRAVLPVEPPGPGHRSIRTVEVNFARAARKLKTLVRQKSKSTTTAIEHDWSAVFEETVPDGDGELEIEMED
jgi:type IV secretion system protein VirD4